jgi:aldose 1-epimerase
MTEALIDMYRLEHRNLHLTVSPAGGRITAFNYQMEKGTLELLRPAQVHQAGNDVSRALASSMFPLVPYCNRVANNTLRHGDQTWTLTPNFGAEPLACHGDGWSSRWQVVSQAENTLTMVLEQPQPNPYAYRATQTFTLSDDSLEVSLAVTNLAAETMPFGLGFHPYFWRHPELTVSFAADYVWLEGPSHLPSEALRVPEELDFRYRKNLSDVWRNLCYSGWQGTASLHYPTYRLDLRSSAHHLMLFTPPGENYLCLEPMTHAVDAFSGRLSVPFAMGECYLSAGERLEANLSFTLTLK